MVFPPLINWINPFIMIKYTPVRYICGIIKICHFIKIKKNMRKLENVSIRICWKKWRQLSPKIWNNESFNENVIYSTLSRKATHYIFCALWLSVKSLEMRWTPSYLKVHRKHRGIKESKSISSAVCTPPISSWGIIDDVVTDAI